MIERAPVLTPTEARQASPRRMNFRVLVTSMILALVAGAVAYVVFYGYPRQPAGEAAPSATSAQPVPSTQPAPPPSAAPESVPTTPAPTTQPAP